eukprot:gene667-biopygen560
MINPINDHSQEDLQNVYYNTPQKVVEEAPGFFSCATLKVAQVNLITGLMYGYMIGYVGVYSTMYDFSTTCSDYKSRGSCTSLENVNCDWVTEGTGAPYCGWVDQPACKQLYFDEHSCEQVHRCTWDYSDKKCGNEHGYTAMQKGVFAGAMTVGGIVGNIIGGQVMVVLGPKRTFLAVGVSSLLGGVLYHVSIAVDSFWCLCVSRLVVGVACGAVCIAAPMYVALNAAPRYRDSIGCMFQLSLAFGIFLASFVGLCVGQTIDYEGGDQIVTGRMHIIAAFSVLLCIPVILLGIFLGGKSATDENGEEVEAAAEEFHQDEYTWRQMIRPLFVGVLLAGTLQLTGINAVMNFAPAMMDRLGMAPLVGNCFLMFVSFVGPTVSIPLASFISMRTLFLAGSCITSASCLFLCGIPVYPGVISNDNVKSGIAIAGLLVFIGAFGMCVGPTFYVLSQEVFPRSFRPKGSSFTLFTQSVFTLIISCFYPSATQYISGGPSGDQNKGQAVAFMFFGCTGLICFVFQIFLLYRAKHYVRGTKRSIREQSDRKDSKQQTERKKRLLHSGWSAVKKKLR